MEETKHNLSCKAIFHLVPSSSKPIVNNLKNIFNKHLNTCHPNPTPEKKNCTLLYGILI